jgi:hypothetical protein
VWGDTLTGFRDKITDILGRPFFCTPRVGRER